MIARKAVEMRLLIHKQYDIILLILKRKTAINLIKKKTDSNTISTNNQLNRQFLQIQIFVIIQQRSAHLYMKPQTFINSNTLNLSEFDLSDKKLHTRSKKSNIKVMLPPIEIPSAKRAVKIEQQQAKSQRKGSRHESKSKGDRSRKKNNGGDEEKQSGHEEDKITDKKQNKTPKTCIFDIKKIISKQETSKLKMSMLKKYEKICDILQYLYNQFPHSSPSQKQAQAQSSRNQTYQQWQLLQIQQNYNDTNLGDFVIKMVNPDYLPEDYKKAKKIEDNLQVSLFQSLRMYDDFFNTQQEADKNMDQCQELAYYIAFCLLDLDKRTRLNKISERQKNQLNHLVEGYEFLVKIADLDFNKYLQIKKNPQFKQFQLPSEYKEDNDTKFVEEFSKGKFELKEMEKKFLGRKEKIYKYLRQKIIGRNNRSSISEFDREKIDNVLIRVPSISQFLRFFPQLVGIMMKRANDVTHLHRITVRHKKKSDKQLTRDLCKGGYLSRETNEGELKWFLNRQRPADVLTLVRKFMVYKLTRRGGLFIRSFLSKQQSYIFLVIKASEQHLEKMAQKTNFNMQIELGAVDIFSFQPVDKYGRPLRCNKYIRDVGFVKKYKLFADKQDKDQNLGQKSVQSEALNFYTKALKMNSDQLRAKIILDQQQCDLYLTWLSSKTGIRFIQPDEILNNSQNENQIQEDIWPIYYIYNKMVIEYLSKLKLQIALDKSNKKKYSHLNQNIGLILRLMFLKALNVCNDMYRNYRDRNFKFIRNLFLRRHPLQTIWNQMGQDIPRGYYPYFYSQKNQKIWRKFEINQSKQRSKFSPAARLINTNEIIRKYVNISKTIIQGDIVDFYPIHDPFILKNILVQPYLNVLSSLIDNDGEIMIEPLENKMDVSNNYVEYQCEYTKEDFTKESLEEKLSFKCSRMTDFSVNSIAFYCGEKLAFFFEFRRYLTEKVWPLAIFTFIIQILFWVQNTQVATQGYSYLRSLNNVLMVIMVVINTIWVNKIINGWIDRQKILARSFGTNQLQKNQHQLKRILFQGQMQRNLQTDDLNDQNQHTAIVVIKHTISFFVSVVFVVCMASTILIIFILKTYLLQRDYDQSTITTIPSILIALAVQIYSYIYRLIIKILVQFQNKKTIPQYQSSLASKSFIVNFLVSYFAIFIYAFFAQYFDGDTVCTIITTTGQQINDCYFYISSQIVTSALTDLALTIVMAFVPLLMFYYTKYTHQKSLNNQISFNLNYFQSIDQFYQQQDRMQTYMQTDQIDRTWQGYTQVVIGLTTLILFAPIVPFLYIMMYVLGVVSLNAKKYEIIYFSKRILPIKVNSIGNWVTILKIMDVLGVFINIALIIYVRNVITEQRAIVFFSCVFSVLVLKYLLSFSSKDQDEVGKRCRNRIEEMINDKGSANNGGRGTGVNTDIENLYYDEVKLKRRLPVLRAANINYK